MPEDNTIPQTSRLHSNAADPYPCSQRDRAPGTMQGDSHHDWGVKYGFCRTSLDRRCDKDGKPFAQGQHDPRCPASCPHKAPEWVAIEFTNRWAITGNDKAAAWAEKLKASGNYAKPMGACWCASCDHEQNGWATRMSICPKCGDKRCEKAGNHLNACSAE